MPIFRLDRRGLAIKVKNSVEEKKGFEIDDSGVLRYDCQPKSAADLLENQI